MSTRKRVRVAQPMGGRGIRFSDSRCSCPSLNPLVLQRVVIQQGPRHNTLITDKLQLFAVCSVSTSSAPPADGRIIPQSCPNNGHLRGSEKHLFIQRPRPSNGEKHGRRLSTNSPSVNAHTRRVHLFHPPIRPGGCGRFISARSCLFSRFQRERQLICNSGTSRAGRRMGGGGCAGIHPPPKSQKRAAFLGSRIAAGRRMYRFCFTRDGLVRVAATKIYCSGFVLVILVKA